ncbi:hypothetical protein [Streptomyces liliiviolaceus]|uniref:hypothetical protein n=1 Tax=Streptomyces liliiviolaceus TaxID=2823109 RepID=UPI001FFD54E5|nr:hypothetical protein [Streptomyces liliiviolaceus]
MPVRPTFRRTPLSLTAAAVLAVTGWTAVGAPAGAPPRHRAPEPPAAATVCSPAGTLKGPGGQRASVSLCASGGGAGTSLSAPATCRRSGTTVRYACLTSGTWTLRRDGRTVATGPLPGGRETPGPGTYEVSGAVHVRSSPAGVDLRGTVRATLTLTDPKPVATHRIEVDRHTLRPHGSATLTYTVARDSDAGDGSARFGLIGEEASGVELTTSDARCVNPLTGRHPSTARSMYALDCALTDLQPGRPSTVVVHARVADACTSIVSKLGYWMPRGQTFHTGGMLAGPTVGCDPSTDRGR